MSKTDSLLLKVKAAMCFICVCMCVCVCLCVCVCVCVFNLSIFDKRLRIAATVNPRYNDIRCNSEISYTVKILNIGTCMSEQTV